MLAFLYYCLKVIVCSGILYGYYLLALRNNRFHQWNRWYLLAAVVLSFSIPLLRIPLPDFFGTQPQLVYGGEAMVLPTFNLGKKDIAFHFSLPFAAACTYAAIALFLLLLLVKNILAIRKLKHTYPEETIAEIHFYNTAEPGTPFSFFKNIFWNSSIDLHTEKGGQMLRHEMAHVTEMHSADKVFLQLLTALAFWNPFLYLIKKELSVVHEFIADQRASAGDDQLQYASLLLMKAMGSRQFALGNPFFHSQLKRRLVMLTSNKNPRFSYLRRLLVLPLAAISLILFSFKYKEIKDKQKAASPVYAATTGEENFYGDTTKPKLYIQLNKSYKGSAIESIMPTTDMSGAVVKTVDDKTYFLDREAAAKEFNFIITDSGFMAPPGAVLVTGTSRVVAKKGAFIQVPPFSKFPQYEYTIDTTTYGLLQVTPSLQAQNIHIDLKQGLHSVYGSTKIDVDSLPSEFRNALIIVDGAKTDFSKLKNVDLSSFKSLDVFNGETAIAKYGQDGKGGVIVITTNGKNSLPDNPLYVLDGVESTKEKADALEQAKIKSVNVLKGESAIIKYGSKGQSGVIEITTTDQTPAWLNDKTLLIKDGKEVSQEEIKGIGNKGVITSYTELTPTAAMKIYGERGKNGAAIVTTKLAKNEVTFPEVNQNNRSADLVVIGHKTVIDSFATKTGTATMAAKQPEDLKEVVVVGYQKKTDYEKVFTKVDNPASFPGGLDGWRRYLERNLKYPVAAQEKGTQGTVKVQMVVAEDGNVTDLKALNDPGNGLAEEAVRVIAKGPKWIPATQNGHPVTYRFVQTLTFQLQ